MCIRPLFLLLILLPGFAQAQTTRFARFPTVNGNTVVFTAADDLWVSSISGGLARRLTHFAGVERRAQISPDGTQVAFIANFEGTIDLYVMPIAGGTPKRLTYDSDSESVPVWTPDGKIAYSSAAGSFNARQTRLWIVSPVGGLPHRTPLDEFAYGTFYQRANKVAYNRTASFAINWRGYRGGYRSTISFYDFATNRYSQMAAGRENCWYPMVVGDDQLLYTSDRSWLTANLYLRDLKSGKDRRLTKFEDGDVKTPSTDGRHVVYERYGRIHVRDLKSGSDTQLAIEFPAEGPWPQPAATKVAKDLSDLDVSLDGTQVVAEARGDIFAIEVATGEGKNLTASDGARERFPKWSPDGRAVAYVSDATGESAIVIQAIPDGSKRKLIQNQGSAISQISWSPDGMNIAYYTDDLTLRIIPASGGVPEKVFQTMYVGATEFDWSPDGRWLAYNTPSPTGLSAIFLYEVARKRSVRVSSGLYDDKNVCFDENGRYLYFVSARTFRPMPGYFGESLKIERPERVYVLPLTRSEGNPLRLTALNNAAKVEVDELGIADRAFVLPFPSTTGLILSPGLNGVLIYHRDPVTDAVKLTRFNLLSQKQDPLHEGDAITMTLGASGAWAGYFANQKLGVVPLSAPFKVGDGQVGTSDLEGHYDPRMEWRQMYWEVWRFERDNFYRADMGGVDWRVAGERYASLLPTINSRSELGYLMRLLLSELKSSHAYADDAAEPPISAPRPALLGCDYEAVGDFVRISRVLRGSAADEQLRSPLGEPGIDVSDGTYLLAIDGQPVRAHTHPGAALVGKSEKPVSILVNSRPSAEGARTVTVHPIAGEATLRLYGWVEENRRKVDRLSGGRIAYIYYPSTGQAGQREFLRTFYGQADKQAVILDDRFNGGGKPQPMVLQTLAFRPQSFYVARYLQQNSDIASIPGPKAIIINGYAGSGGDLTPAMFREAKMGKIIGTRTYGALLGISAYLYTVDGAEVSAPSYGRFDLKTGEQIAENLGVMPDIWVDNEPNMTSQGRDPQLEATVKHLLQELKRHSTKLPKPRYRSVSKGGAR